MAGRHATAVGGTHKDISDADKEARWCVVIRVRNMGMCNAIIGVEVSDLYVPNQLL